MDRPRDESEIKKRKQKRIAAAGAGVLALIVITVWLSSFKAAAFPVERETVWLGTVERGDMPLRVRGPGTLQPEAILWITAETEGTVQQKVILPGVEVTPDSVILELTNPTLEQQALDAELALQAADVQSRDLEVRLESEVLNQQAEAAAVQADYESATMDAAAQKELAKEGLTPEIELKRAQMREKQLAERAQIEVQRLAKKKESVQAQLASQKTQVEQLRAMHQLRQSQLDRLRVRAGIAGVLQDVPVEVGQRVQPGANLARVADPGLLKAVLQIPQVQAKDLQNGQRAEIDTRNGVVEGRVKRVDPAVREGTVTVDVEIVGELPRGARPDLSVEGIIELALLTNVLKMGRPTSGQANSDVELYKVMPGGEAQRQLVKLGKASVNEIEILEGLQEGDQVILSDTSNYDEHPIIQLK
jgi:HlyD family secretion protein